MFPLVLLIIFSPTNLRAKQIKNSKAIYIKQIAAQIFLELLQSFRIKFSMNNQDTYLKENIHSITRNSNIL